MNWISGRGDSGFFGAFGYVAWLTKEETPVLLDDVDGEERLKVVGFGYGVACLEDVAEFMKATWEDTAMGTWGDMKAEVDAFAVGTETLQEAGILLRA